MTPPIVAGPIPAPFNLLRWFLVSGMLVIVIISIFTSYVLAAFLEEHLMRRDAAIMKAFVERVAWHHDPRGHFTRSFPRVGATTSEFFRDISHMPDVALTNAFSTDGTVVWSSDPTLIGRRFTSNHELDDALTGELVYERGNLGPESGSGHRSLAKEIDWFIENYIPIRGPDNGDIVGVVEIYRIPISLSRSIELGRQLVWFTALAGGALLFLTLLWGVRRGQRLITSQQTALIDNARLATIGEMASSVAHSIRNPVASIRSSAELALDGLRDPDAAESFRDIIGEVDRFDGWIKELLIFTSEAGDPGATSRLDEVVANSLGAFVFQARRKGVRIENRLPGELPRVRGESALLVQVINSLVANALEAMPHGGTLVATAVRCGCGIRIILSDSGFGIPADRLEGLFDPLVTHKSGGLGIGLALVRQVVHRYGGQIEITSALGSGTTVAIEFPIAKVVD